MKVETTLPQWTGNFIQDSLLAAEYDISGQTDGNIKHAKGYAVLDKESVYILENENLLHKIPIKELDHIRAEKDIGSGELICAYQSGDQQVLCCFTVKLFEIFAEFGKIVTRYIHTGQESVIIPIDVKTALCPKCGFPLSRGSNICPKCLKKGAVLLRVLKMCWAYKYKLIVIIAVAFLLNASGLISPYFRRRIVDDYIVPLHNDVWGVFWWTAMSIGFQIVNAFLNTISRKQRSVLSLDITKDLRQQVFNKVQSLSASTLSNRTTGDLMNRISQDTSTIREFINDLGARLVIDAAGLIATLGIMIYMNPLLTLYAVITVPLSILFMQTMWGKMHKLFHNAWAYTRKTSTILHDIINGIRIVKTFGNEKKETVNYENASQMQAASNSKSEIFWATRFPWIGFFITAGEYVVLFVASYMILRGKMELGEMLQFMTYAGTIYGSIRWFVRIPRDITRMTVSASKVFEILDEPSDFDAEEKNMREINGDIEFKNVSFGYKSYVPVLKNMSFTVKSGEIIGLVGASGSGKSTTTNLIMRLYDIDEGEIFVDGIRMGDIDKHHYKSQLGVVLQETFLFDDTILANIAYAKPGATFTEIIEAAKIANAHDFISKLPAGYQTLVGDRGYSLSGGERQRIAIARAILHKPRILILDEATSSLDAETEKLIQDALAKLIKGRTTFIIAHRLSTLSHADRLFVMDEGCLVETGTHRELMMQRGIYYGLVMAQRQTAKIKK